MKTVMLPFTILSLAFLAGMSLAETPDVETIRLRPGFQQILEQTGVSRISIGNPEIIEAQPLPKGDGIIVVGKKEGETDLVVWTKGVRTDRKVEVRESNTFTVEEARAFAAGFPGISVTEAGSTVFVAGTVSSQQDRILWEDFARTRPTIRLRITLPEEGRSLLSYDLKIIEISKGMTSQIGVRWPDSLSAKGSWQAGGDTASAFTVAGDFDARLNLLLADGRARILANPRLVCETGESANFLAGGEIPIVIVTPETRTVEWKTYGIVLKLQPKMDKGNRIRTQITAEISTVDHGSGSSQVPAFLTRRVTTNISSASGGTVMLSGLVKSEMAKDVAKIPLLGQIPVLGELFKSRSFRENQTELAIFITPSEVRGDSLEEAVSWNAKLRKEQEKMRFRLID
ncbi:MAG: pilus assembly protein N-terminal domain-containing protein [Deltaproteobacteria bacterium]|nr:pilus assembly protein N-terminal domain-containing protein [Deltaproteobacteria bacterium]